MCEVLGELKDYSVMGLRISSNVDYWGFESNSSGFGKETFSSSE